MGDVERRILRGEVRAAAGRRLEGYAAVFNVRSQDLGGFVEEIKPGAFQKALRRSDVRALFNHNPDHVLGRMRNGTLRLAEDSRGLHFEIDLPRNSFAESLLESVRRGDIDGASFSFTVPAGGDRWHDEGGLRVRTVHEIGEVFDVGPVTFPAYEATVVSARALERARARGAPAAGGGPGLEWYERRQRLALLKIQADEAEARRRGLPPDPWSDPAEPRADWEARWATAVHEASHALIYYLEGVPLRRLALLVRRDASGGVQGVDGYCTGDGDPGFAVHLAGYAGEDVFGLRYSEEEFRRSGDYQKAARKLRAMGLDPDRRIPYERAYAQGLIRIHEHAVRELAHALMDRGELSGREAERILARAVDWGGLVRYRQLRVASPRG